MNTSSKQRTCKLSGLVRVAQKHCVFFIILIFWLSIAISQTELILANSHQDSNLSFYTYLHSHLNDFKADVFGYYSSNWIRGSAVFFLPVFLSQYLAIPTVYYESIFFAIQILLIFIYFYVSTYLFTKSVYLSLTSLALAICISAWASNVAAYTMDIFIPLYTTLAVSVTGAMYICYRLGFFIASKLLIIISVLIHPVIGFYNIFNFSIYVLLGYMKRKSVQYTDLLTILFACAIGMSMYFFSKIPASEAISKLEYFEVVKLHMHSVPWAGIESVFYKLLIKTIALLCIIFYLIKRVHKYSLYNDSFGRSIIIGSIILAASTPVAYILKSPFFLLFQGFRSVENIIIYFWPLAFLGIKKILENYPRSIQYNKTLRLVFSTALGSLSILLLTVLNPSLKNYYYTRESLVLLKEAQLWTKENTNQNSIIITNLNWRTISERPVARVIPDYTVQLYSPYKNVATYNYQLNEMYGIDMPYKFTIAQLAAMYEQGYKRLNETDFRALAKKFNACFLVRKFNEKKLDLNIVYSNKAVIIYNICYEK